MKRRARAGWSGSSPKAGSARWWTTPTPTTRCKRALEAARTLARGRLIVVFGCGGDRDKGKRPLMGQAAAESADLVVVTSDNPRTEDPDEIIAQITAGRGEGRAAPDERRARPRAASAATWWRPTAARRSSSARRLAEGRATWCSSPARATRTTRSSATEKRPFDDVAEAPRRRWRSAGAA